MVVHLRSVAWREGTDEDERYPFAVPAIAALRQAPLSFDRPVTFLVGENGSGKSTLLEAIACAAGSIALGSAPLGSDPSLAPARQLAATLKLTWRARTRTGFFLRAEDVFGFAKLVDRTRDDLEADRRVIAEDASLSDKARGLGQMAYARELAELRRRYGAGADARSHGETFLALFRDRLIPRGLYLLDEPEAPLSPLRQLALLALLIEASGPGESQFLVATHSPILTALPGATILSLDEGSVRPVAWDDLDHVRVTRQFLNDPEAFFRHL
ncbi:MAG: ABC transporter, ATP-binding protein [uncultured Thermomicrobiales bacterium]|uniref:ABC transporter, ATP-binding protein n=1 Tax=uncultured Thermomicrobiales bacterium TaxID=1645740 RepID=A0A6J4VJ28_9BACT|nr:MAG: ABC transporter, ATP-binding protein [uncultured Thermomicrobiales bacterium]